ncbi:uncharacterized protein LOC125695232 [Lagopus muta]|uniref:uncharacterized protein LOC125695232 n=1 Tax=Lagopus muta TaxID=64668 RepID=UPI00209FE3CC|nr:uncharacterized protein LOC125695232 [Lagopus muta]
MCSEEPPVLRWVSLAPSFQRRWAVRCGAGLGPFVDSGLGSRARPLAVLPRCLAAESRSRCCGGNRAPWLRGCRRPACNQGQGVGAFVLWWQPVWGDRPVSGVQVKVPPTGSEGASLSLWDHGCPVSKGLALESQALCNGSGGWGPPVSGGGADSLSAALRAQLPLPRQPDSAPCCSAGWTSAACRCGPAGEERSSGMWSSEASVRKKRKEDDDYGGAKGEAPWAKACHITVERCRPLG